MIELKEIDSGICDIINDFPTNSARLLHPKSYFRCVYSYLLECNRFLEIGYRKGLFVEVCKHLNIDSVHIDITDKLLRAIPSSRNRCFTVDSLNYLSKCSETFCLIFQDGSKDYNVRKKEYDLIMERSILDPEGIILVDDLHYKSCRKSLKYAKKQYGMKCELFEVQEKDIYNIGILSR